MTKFKILHVITTINRGGAENHLVDLVLGQLEAGSQVIVVYMKGDGYWREKLSSAGCLVIPLDLQYYGEIKPVTRLSKFFKEFHPDIIHAHMPPAELYTRLALLVSGFKGNLVISKHNDERFFSGFGERFIGRWVLSRAKRVIAISNAVRRHVEANLNPRPNQIVTVHYGIDPRPYEEVSPEAVFRVRDCWRVPKGAYVIGTVARLVPQKALHVLFRAFAQHRAGAVRESRLVVVGRGPLEGDLKELTYTLGIEDAVVWAGFREDIHVVMRSFDCFALTSIYEGFGLVLLEAMAAERAVVATSVSAIPEVVTDEVTGILCPAGNIESIALALSRLAESEMQSALGKAGVVRVRKYFSIDSMVCKTMSIYRECL